MSDKDSQILKYGGVRTDTKYLKISIKITKTNVSFNHVLYHPSRAYIIKLYMTFVPE
jgi:hypothetical protein